VTLTADPDATSTFAGWSGDCSGTGSCQVTLGEARSVTATFTREDFDLSVSKAGSGSGQVSSSPAGISCGATCQASFEAGTHVTLSATPAAASRFSGWSGDCVGTGDCTVTLDQARSVTATFAANARPHASFTYSCSALTCSFDAGDSADSDGSIVASSWYFGDGTSGGGTAVNHAYATAAGFTVTLKVTDNEAASDTTSQQITLIDLTARGSKLKGLQRVELSWSGASGASFDVYRDGSRIASGVQAMSYTDNLNRSGSRSYSYRVYAAAICSNPVMVTF
jgi:PKD domain/Divergent InlB B-repeat domain